MQDSPIIAFTTFPKIEDARHIGTELVKRQCAVCVNLLPQAESIYRWKGEICREPEILAIIKTTASRLPALQNALRDLHPYECPELLTLPITGGLPAYLDWLLAGGS